VRLTLKDLFFDGASGNEPINETILLLTVSPDSRQSLLICRGIPVYHQILSMREIPGSNRIKRFAPMRLRPQPPALELRRKTNSGPSGSLNLSTSFWRLLTFMVPSSRRQPYLRQMDSEQQRKAHEREPS